MYLHEDLDIEDVIKKRLAMYEAKRIKNLNVKQSTAEYNMSLEKIQI